MEKRFEGFLAPHGLYILDTFTGEVRFIQHAEDSKFSNKSLEGINVSAALIEQKNSQPSLSPFENEVVSSYPYLIAKPFADLLKEKDARMKCKLMVDTFTAVLKYLALQLASEYLRANDVKDIQVHQTLTKDLSRPLISAWNLLIARCLPVLTDHKVPLFSPEIKAAYEKLESKCKDPKLVEQKYSDENGEIKTKTKKLGKIQALINYRNGLAHGFNQSQARAQKEFDEYYPLLCDILQEVRFVSRYTLWHVESNRQGVNGMRLMGANPTMTKIDFDREGINPAISPLFLINDGSGEILPLYAFFDVDDANETGLPEIGKDVFVFEGNTKSTVIYLSTSGEHLEKSSRFQHWKELLAQKQMEVEWADTKNLTLDTLHSIGKHISVTSIQALIASAKYLREATIPRQDLNELLDSFSYGDFNGFVLGGESGIGKSTLLAQKTEEWQADGHMVAFYRGSALNQSDIANKFLRDCALKVNYLEDYLSVVHTVFSQTDKKCYIIVDALNEYAGDLNELIKSVENMVAQASNYPWFKIIVSVRDSVYNRINTRFGELTPNKYFTVEEEKGGEKVRTNIIRLQAVAKDFVAQLYNAYRDYKWKDNTDSEDEGYYIFRPLTEYSELDIDGSTVRLIRSPLMARLVMQSFHRAKLPQQLTNYDAMRLYHDNIVLEKSDNSLGFPERKKLLTLFVTELDKNNSERIDRDKLIQHNALRPYLINNQRDSAYIQLLDLGILMEEWEADDCFVRFAFDKLYEFLLAELHWPRVDDAISLMALCKRATSFKILQGAIEIMLIRFCQNNQSQQLVMLIDLADQENNEVKELLKDTTVRLLEMLCNEDSKLFEEIINEFPKQPGELDLRILQELLDKLYLTGQLEGFEKTMEVAAHEAELLDNQKVLSDLMLSSAQYDMLQGRYQNARKKLNDVIEIKTALMDEYGRLIGMRKLGALEWREGNMERSMNIFSDALAEAKESGFDDLKSAFMNNLGILKGYFGMRLEQEELYYQSLEIRKRIGDKKGISESLGTLGVLYKNQGKIEEAEKLYLESLEISRQLGDKKGISDSLMCLGLLHKNQGKIEEAEKLYLESLEIDRQLGDKKGISASLASFGNLYRDQGKIEEAEKLYLESLEIYRQLGDKKGISISLMSLGLLYEGQGKIYEAEKLHLESLDLKRQLGNKKGISASLGNLGVLYKSQGKIEEAEKLHLESLEIDRQLGDKKGISASLSNLGIIYKNQGKIEEAEKLYLESLEISRQLGDKKGISTSLGNLGVLYKKQGKIEEAEKFYLESLEISRQLGDKKGISNSSMSLGLLYKNQGKIKEAEKLYLESLEIDHQLGDKKGISLSLANLGNLYRYQGKIEEAEKLHLESLEIKRQLGDKKGISASLSNLGIIYKDQGKIEEAEKLHLESLEIKRQLGDKKGISASLSNLGFLYKIQGKIEEAIKQYLDSLEIKIQLGDKNGTSNLLLELADLNLGNLEKVEECYIEIINKLDKLDKNQLANLLIELVKCLKGNHKLKEALFFALKTLEILRQIEDKKLIANFLNYIGLIQSDLGNFNEAEKYYLETLELSRQIDHKIKIRDSLGNLGILYKKLKRTEEAFLCFHDSLNLSRHLEDNKSLIMTLNYIGNLYLSIEKTELSEKYFFESLTLSKETKSSRETADTLMNLGVLYFELSNDIQSLDYFKESIEIKRELLEKDTLLATIHRAFSLFDETEQEKLFNEVQQLDKKDFRDKEHCWLLNIELMHGCLNKSEINTAEIITLSDKILDLSAQTKLNDIDDLPVEAFYIAAFKLTELTSTEAATNLAKKALEWIGDRKTRRKEELVKIINSTK